MAAWIFCNEQKSLKLPYKLYFMQSRKREELFLFEFTEIVLP